MDTAINHVWHAENYHRNSGVQKKAAHHLLDQLNLIGHEVVLDVGCGDGKNTLEIAERVGKGLVYGTDLSKEMIDFAKKNFQSRRNNLFFEVQNGENIEFSIKFDLIFSSFALQWVGGIKAFFQGAYQYLKPEGCLACTIPLGISDELEEALAFLLRQNEWTPFFHNFEQKYFMRNEKIYNQLLIEHGFFPRHFEVVHQNWMFPSRKELETYILMWLPHLAYLPKHLQKNFFDQLIDKYMDLTPLMSGGKVPFLFPRVDFIAHKKR